MNASFSARSILAAALVCAAAARADEAAQIPVGDLKWVLPPCAKLEGDILTVEVGPDTTGDTRAWAAIDLSECRHGFAAEIVARGENISKPSAPWLGFKFMVHYRDPALDTDCWPGCEGGFVGTFTNRTFHIRDRHPGRVRANARLCLGLQDSTGKAVFDLSTLKIWKTEEAFPKFNQDFRVKYPERVLNRPQRRGVMSPGNPTEQDFADLHEWGATLMRYQMWRTTWGWTEAQLVDLAAYREWLDGRLDLLDRILDWAEKYDIDIVVDLHHPPGGSGQKGLRMFYRQDCLDEFLATWRKIATRFKGKKRIYGYDLVNEPTHGDGVICDYLEAQRRAAEAVREIDPDVTIIIESNGMDVPVTYDYLSPLAMDNVIYEVHTYNPGAYAFQGVFGRGLSDNFKPWPSPDYGWNRNYIVNDLRPVAEFAKRHGAKIYVGEFSAASWLPGAEKWIADSISVFNEYGWDWTYHAFRESPTWSVEHEGTNRDNLKPAADTPRKRVLIDALRGETAAFRMYGQTLEAQFASAAEAESATLSFRELPPDMEMSLSARSDDTNWRHLDHASALAAAGAKCTYYIGGVSSDYAEKVLRPILALGHSLGSHTRNHPHLPAFNANGIFSEILGNRIDIEAATDSCVSSFTLPFCDWNNRANPGARAAIGESLRRSGILGGGDVLEDPAATYGLPANAFVGCLRYSFDDRNPSRDLFVKGVGKAEERIKAKDLPPCGPHVVMGMHSWANDDGMAELTPCFETRTKNPDAPFAGRTWVCNENEFIAAWMQAHHAHVAQVERTGDRVRWTILRPEPAELGADVPLFAEFNPKPIAIALDGAAASVTESAQAALPNSKTHRIPSLIEHLPMTKDDSGDIASSKKFPGLNASLKVDPDGGQAVLYLKNASDAPLCNLRATLRLPLAFAPTAIPQGGALPETINPGDDAEAHFRLERLHDGSWFIDGPAFFDAELDFDIGDKAGRLHVTRLILAPRTEDGTSLRDSVRAAVPLHVSEWPADRLAELSRPGSSLEGLRLFPLDASPSYASCAFNFSSRLPEAQALAAAFPKEAQKDLLNLLVGEFTASGRDATLVTRGGGTLYINGEKVEFANGTHFKTVAGLNRMVLSLPMNDWRKHGILAVFEDGADSPCIWSPPAL